MRGKMGAVVMPQFGGGDDSPLRARRPQRQEGGGRTRRYGDSGNVEINPAGTGGIATGKMVSHARGKHAQPGCERHCRSIKGDNDVDRMDEADTSPWLLSRGSSRLLLQLPFCHLVLFAYLLFPTLVLIRLALVSHCLSPFGVVAHLFAARAPLRRGGKGIETPTRRLTGAPSLRVRWSAFLD